MLTMTPLLLSLSTAAHAWIPQTDTLASAESERQGSNTFKFNTVTPAELVRLDELTVVHPSPDQEGRVYFGAWVTLEDESGELTEYRLVGPDEFDVEAGRISIASPMGRALVGREEGDEFVLNRPKGPALYTVVAIRYDPGPG